MVKDYYGDKDDLLMCYLYQKGMDIIHDMRVFNNDAPSFLQRSS